MLDDFKREIEIFPRRNLDAGNSDSWPKPKKHQYYNLRGLQQTTVSLHLVKAIQRRTDINCIKIDLDSSKLDDLFEKNDRSWSVILYLPLGKKLDHLPDTNVPKRALSALRNVQYLRLENPSYCHDPPKVILDNLPFFKNLQSLNLGGCRIHPTELITLSEYPFADHLAGIDLGRLLTPSQESSKSFGFFTSETAKRVNTGIHATFVLGMDDGLHQNNMTVSMTDLLALRCVKELHMYCDDHLETSMTPIATILEWLKSPQCSVTDLLLSLDVDDDEASTKVLKVLPQIPRLEALWLGAYGGDVEDVFPILLETPILETVTWIDDECDDHVCKRILEFQLSSRPRLFSIQLSARDTLNCDGPQRGSEAKKIHHVSLVHQTLQKFHRSKEHSSFPLSAWSFVLEELGSAFDCRSSVVHAVGVDARFNVLQELLGAPYRMVENTDSIATTRRENATDAKRRRIQPPR